MTVVNFCNSFYYKNKSTNENYTYCHSLYLHDARPIILMPDTQSAEKQSALRGMGAELRTVPAVPYKNPDNYVHQARRLAEAMAANTPGGVFYANQWDNLANRNGHTVSTGPEI